MSIYACLRPFLLAKLFVKEQLKEPVALFWIIISPGVAFYLLSYSRGITYSPSSDYLSSVSWFYAYVASSVALFGFGFYIAGRRESGFVRSFVYTPGTKIVFLLGQFIAYSFVSLLYGVVFYLMTHFVFGPVDFYELGTVLVRFYICFVLFSIPSLLMALVPVSFQNANTMFSVASFAMLVAGVMGMSSSSAVMEVVKLFNPLWWANEIMTGGLDDPLPLVLGIAVAFVIVFFVAVRFMPITPVWSRY